MRKWESEKHKSWRMPAEGFKGHVTTDGSLLGNDGRWGASGWAVVQLDYDEEMGPLQGIYCSMETEYEVQPHHHAFPGKWKVSEPIKVHVDNKGIIDGLRKGEKECIKPRAGDADLWFKIWEELHELVRRGILVEVAHVKAHRTKKETAKMTQYEKFVIEGNEKADDLAKAGGNVGRRIYGRSESCYCEAGERGSVRSLGDAEEERIIREREYQRLLNKFEMEGIMAQKGIWNLAKEKTMKERGKLPNEEDDAVREYKPCAKKTSGAVG